MATVGLMVAVLMTAVAMVPVVVELVERVEAAIPTRPWPAAAERTAGRTAGRTAAGGGAVPTIRAVAPLAAARLAAVAPLATARLAAAAPLATARLAAAAPLATARLAAAAMSHRASPS